MKKLDRNAVPFRNQDLITREVEDEIYICSDDGETMHVLADVAADIWQACDGAQTVGDIEELLLAAYDVDPETLAADLVEYLEDLQAKKLIIFH
jgi:hypothetical protein